jgi:hypothetical protein
MRASATPTSFYGNVSNISIVDSDPTGVFDETAQVAARQYHFAPKCGPSFNGEFVVYQYFQFTLSGRPPLPPILAPFENFHPSGLELRKQASHAYLRSIDPCEAHVRSPDQGKATP